VAHRRAKLTALGRRLLVDRILCCGSGPTSVAMTRTGTVSTHCRASSAATTRSDPTDHSVERPR
jgi:hypothetical protein